MIFHWNLCWHFCFPSYVIWIGSKGEMELIHLNQAEKRLTYEPPAFQTPMALGYWFRYYRK